MDYWLSGRRTFHHQIFDIVVPQKELVNFYNLVFTEPDRIEVFYWERMEGVRTEELVVLIYTYCLNSLDGEN